MCFPTGCQILTSLKVLPQIQQYIALIEFGRELTRFEVPTAAKAYWLLLYIFPYHFLMSFFMNYRKFFRGNETFLKLRNRLQDSSQHRFKIKITLLFCNAKDILDTGILSHALHLIP